MFGIGLKTDIQTNGTEQRVQKKPSGIWSNDLWQESQDHTGERIVSATNGTGKPRYPNAKETSHIKVNSKWSKDLNVRPETIKHLEENRGKVSGHWIWQGFLWCNTKRTGNKTKTGQMWQYQILTLLHSKGNNQNEKATNGMEKTIRKPCIW